MEFLKELGAIFKGKVDDRGILPRRHDIDSRRYQTLHIFLILLLTFSVWSGVLKNEFVWDDTYFVVQNPAIRNISHVPSYFTDLNSMAGKGYAEQFAVFRPLRNLSYLLDFQCFGLRPTGWHLHNLFLHSINAILIYGIATALGIPLGISFFITMVFSLHPVQTEAVAWIKGRDDLLCLLYLLAGVWLWIKWRENLTPLRILALLTIYLATCLAKVQGIILPALWGGLELTHLGNFRWQNLWKKNLIKIWILSACTGLIYLFWRHWFIGKTAQTTFLAPPFPLFLTMVHVGAEYLRLLFFPLHLLSDYSGMEIVQSPTDPRFWGSALLLLFTGALVVLISIRIRHFAFAALWVAFALLPMSNIVPMMQFMAERFLYLATPGFAIGTGLVLLKLQRFSKRLTYLVATVVVLGFAPQTIRRVPVWRSEIRLFTTTVNDTPPGVMRPRMNLLATLVNTHDPDRILDYTEKLQAEINRLNLEVSPRNRAEILRHRGFAFLMQEQTELGIKNLRMAQQTDPLYEQIYLDLGILDGKRGQHQAALEFFQKGLLLSPSHVNLLYSQGIALQELGKPSEAEKSFRKAIHFGYDKPDAHRSLAALLWSQNRIPEASGIYKDALKIWPEDQDIHYWYQRSLKSPPTP